MANSSDLERASQGLLDFHTHSTYSDGGDTPEGLVMRAFNKGVSAMALTDHHANRGLPEFRKACEKHGVLGIPFGVEISARLPLDVLSEGDNEAPDLVILGKNANEKPMKDYMDKYFQFMRNEHLSGVIRGLESVGFKFPEVDLDGQCASFHCPPDILHDFVEYEDNIKTLIDYLSSIGVETDEGLVREKPIRFVNRHLYAPGKPAYFVRVGEFNVDDALNLSEDMNCKLFIAHPGGEYGFLSDRILDYYIEKGVHGMEIRNYFNSPEQNAKFDRLVEGNCLIRSGGSDCHGDNGPFKIGCYDRPHNQVPGEVIKELWERLPS